MTIVPIEIVGREFKKVFRGYDPDEVKRFLEDIATEIGRLMSEKAGMECEIESARNNLAKYHDLEDTIKETLMLAQRTKDDLIEAARRQSEMIVEEAHRESRKIEDRFARTKSMKKQFEIELMTLIEAFRSKLKDLKEPEDKTNGEQESD